MMRSLFSIVCVFALAACTAKAPLSVEVVRSEMARCPEATYIDGLEGKLKWNYTTGLELKAMLDAAPEEAFGYVDAWYDAIIDSAGVIYKYKKSNYSTDHVCPGRTLFALYDMTGKEKYKAAMIQKGARDGQFKLNLLLQDEVRHAKFNDLILK